jgi:tRNA(Ile2) C34 agmatinyltransferase TiaS
MNALRGPCEAGHPVTIENTVSVGNGNGYRCRECRRKIARESASRKAA